MKKLYVPIILLAGLLGYNVQTGNAQIVATSGRPATNADRINSVPEPSNTDAAVAAVKSKKELKGDKLYFIYSYDEAIKSYQGEEHLSVDGQRKLAKSHYNMNHGIEAEAAYEKLLHTPGGNNPEDYYNYAMALKSVEKYDLSGKWMDYFTALKPGDLRAKDYVAHKSELNALLTYSGKSKVKHLDINTDAEDFGPGFYKNKITFASSRTTKSFPKNSYRNGKPYLNIYIADVDNKELKSAENFDKSMNGNMNEGPATFSRDGLFMAYSKNNYTMTKKELIVNVDIYFRTYSENEWSKPVAFAANSKTYSVGHPALSHNGKTMYFTSDMPGGYGGADIYRVTRNETGTWSAPENLGSGINTEGDEVFPFFEEGHDVLFFASNGRFGLGGLDLFSSTMKGSSFGQPLNLGSPLNTSSDDFSMIVDSTMTHGYFASNRKGGSGDDDIYSLEFFNAKIINGFAKDKNDSLLANTSISITDENDKEIGTYTTTGNGAFTFTVETDKNYKLSGKKATYNDGNASANTFGSQLSIDVDIYMLMSPKAEKAPVEKPIAEKAIVKAPAPEKSVAKIAPLSPIYFDYHKYNIRPDAKTELDKIAKVMNDNPTIQVELKSYTDCRSSMAFNQVLSDKRAQATADYLRKKITNPSRLTARGYGETKLISNCACEGNEVSDCSEDAHQQNRRTEFTILIKD